MSVIDLIIRYFPISLQLAGALVVISAMSLVGSISDLLNHAKVIATIPHDESNRIYLNKEMVEMSIEKNCNQVFSAVYIIWGYLGAVIAGNTTPKGFWDALVVAFFTYCLWKMAKVISKNIAKKNADRVRSVQCGEHTQGVVAYKNVEDNSVFR